jgi:hypothetical protein
MWKPPICRTEEAAQCRVAREGPGNISSPPTKRPRNFSPLCETKECRKDKHWHLKRKDDSDQLTGAAKRMAEKTKICKVAANDKLYLCTLDVHLCEGRAHFHIDNTRVTFSDVVAQSIQDGVEKDQGEADARQEIKNNSDLGEPTTYENKVADAAPEIEDCGETLLNKCTDSGPVLMLPAVTAEPEEPRQAVTNDTPVGDWTTIGVRLPSAPIKHSPLKPAKPPKVAVSNKFASLSDDDDDDTALQPARTTHEVPSNLLEVRNDTVDIKSRGVRRRLTKEGSLPAKIPTVAAAGDDEILQNSGTQPETTATPPAKSHAVWGYRPPSGGNLWMNKLGEPDERPEGKDGEFGDGPFRTQLARIYWRDNSKAPSFVEGSLYNFLSRYASEVWTYVTSDVGPYVPVDQAALVQRLQGVTETVLGHRSLFLRVCGFAAVRKHSKAYTLDWAGERYNLSSQVEVFPELFDVVIKKLGHAKSHAGDGLVYDYMWGRIMSEIAIHNTDYFSAANCQRTCYTAAWLHNQLCLIHFTGRAAAGGNSTAGRNVAVGIGAKKITAAADFRA